MKTLSHELEPSLRLTRLQAALHSYLRANSGQTLSREHLCSAVWRMNYYQLSRTIDQTVSVVRKHLADGERIVTVFGIGYRHELSSTDWEPHSRTRQPLEALGAALEG